MTQESKKAIVFVVDDEAMVLKAVSQTVASLDCTVHSFQSPFECVGALQNQACDLLITDVNMPGMDGLTLLAKAKQLQPLMPVLVVTGFGDIPIAVKAVKAGAYDFVEKPLDEETFLPLVKAALALREESDPLHGKSLTSPERQVLKLVAAGLSNKQIAYELDRSVRTVENHRHRLMKKLGVGSTAEMVKIAVQIGLTKEKA